MDTHTISIAESAIRLIIAALRTHMLVGLGSALVMIVSAFGFEDILGHHDVILDPTSASAMKRRRRQVNPAAHDEQAPHRPPKPDHQ